MQFLTPGILWALAAISIPIVIHLFYFRRFKKVYFSNTRFIREIKEQTRNRSRLRNLLVLMCRILAYSFLILAFAQPFIPADRESWQGSRAISIFIDNSFSMQGRSEDVYLLEEAKASAREIVEAYGEEHSYQVLTHDFEGRHQRLTGKEEALELIDEIEISPQSRTLSEILDRQSQVLNETTPERRNRILISDFQRVMLDDDFAIDSLESLRLVPLRAVAEDNLAMDSVWFEQPVLLPNQTAVLYMRVRNYGEVERTDARISFNYSGQSRPSGTVNINPGAAVVDSFSFNPFSDGWQTAEVTVEDYPISFDDTWYLSFRVEDALKVLSLGDQSGPNEYLRAIFENMENAELAHRSLQNIQYTEFPNFNLIVLDEPDVLTSGLISQLQAYINAGGNLLFFPSADGSVESYNDLLGALGVGAFGQWNEQDMAVGSINTEEFIFRDVFERIDRNMTLPRVKAWYGINSYRPQENLLVFRNGTPFLSKYSLEQGRLYLCASPLQSEYSDLIIQGEIFVPMIFRMALASGAGQKLAYTIGRDNTIALPRANIGNDPVFRLEGPVEFIPSVNTAGQRIVLDLSSQLPKAGHYSLQSGDSTLLNVSLNYDRKESHMDFPSAEELEAQYPQASVYRISDRQRLAGLIQNESEGRKLWHLCIIFALLFLLSEQLILRFVN